MPWPVPLLWLIERPIDPLLLARALEVERDGDRGLARREIDRVGRVVADGAVDPVLRVLTAARDGIAGSDRDQR